MSRTNHYLLTESIQDAREYLDRKSLGPDFALATDGFEWVLVKIEQSGDATNFPEVNRVNLRPVFQQMARDRGYIGQSALGPTDVDDHLTEFVETYSKDEFDRRLFEAPRELRDRRQRDVEEFFELYIELLFGESDAYEGDYDTCLLDDIRPPENTEVDEEVSCCTLAASSFLSQNNLDKPSPSRGSSLS